jgi:nitrogen fixation NifU-like protein
MALDDLYQDILLDHYKNPRNHGPLTDADSTIDAKNPFCGDEVKLHVKFEGDRLADIHFEGQGCVISQASVSLLTQYAKGRSIPEIRDLADTFSRLVRGEDVDVDEQGLEELHALEGVADYPTRVKCATLAWNALVRTLNAHMDAEQQTQLAEKGDEHA